MSPDFEPSPYSSYTANNKSKWISWTKWVNCISITKKTFTYISEIIPKLDSSGPFILAGSIQNMKKVSEFYDTRIIQNMLILVISLSSNYTVERETLRFVLR